MGDVSPSLVLWKETLLTYLSAAFLIVFWLCRASFVPAEVETPACPIEGPAWQWVAWTCLEGVSASHLEDFFGLSLPSSGGKGAGRRHWRWLHGGPHLGRVCRLLCSCSILHLFITVEHLQENKRHSEIMLLLKHIF